MAPPMKRAAMVLVSLTAFATLESGSARRGSRRSPPRRSIRRHASGCLDAPATLGACLVALVDVRPVQASRLPDLARVGYGDVPPVAQDDELGAHVRVTGELHDARAAQHSSLRL